MNDQNADARNAEAEDAEARMEKINVQEGLEGRQDFRPGLEVPESRYGAERALHHNDGQPSTGTSPFSMPRTEDEMRQAVRRALDSQRDLDARHIQVEMHDGVILLRGRVTSARMRALAEDALDDFLGVHVIRNEIEVRAGAGGFPSAGIGTGPVIPGELEAPVGDPAQEKAVQEGGRLGHRRSA